MKKYVLAALAAIILGAATVFAQQRLTTRQIPSIIVNKFQQYFPDARDVEWEQLGDIYKVEFETGWQGLDHDLWLNSKGEQVQHTEEIASNSLPEAVTNTLKASYGGYTIDEVKKTTMKGSTTFKIELDGTSQDLKVIIDSLGNVSQTYMD